MVSPLSSPRSAVMPFPSAPTLPDYKTVEIRDIKLEELLPAEMRSDELVTGLHKGLEEIARLANSLPGIPIRLYLNELIENHLQSTQEPKDSNFFKNFSKIFGHWVKEELFFQKYPEEDFFSEVKDEISTHKPLAMLLRSFMYEQTLKLLPEKEQSNLRGAIFLFNNALAIDLLIDTPLEERADLLLSIDQVAKEWCGFDSERLDPANALDYWEEPNTFNIYNSSLLPLLEFKGTQKQRKKIIQATAQLVEAFPPAIPVGIFYPTSEAQVVKDLKKKSYAVFCEKICALPIEEMEILFEECTTTTAPGEIPPFYHFIWPSTINLLPQMQPQERPDYILFIDQVAKKWHTLTIKEYPLDNDEPRYIDRSSPFYPLLHYKGSLQQRMRMVKWAEKIAEQILFCKWAEIVPGRIVSYRPLTEEADQLHHCYFYHFLKKFCAFPIDELDNILDKSLPFSPHLKSDSDFEALFTVLSTTPRGQLHSIVRKCNEFFKENSPQVSIGTFFQRLSKLPKNSIAENVEALFSLYKIPCFTSFLSREPSEELKSFKELFDCFSPKELLILLQKAKLFAVHLDYFSYCFEKGENKAYSFFEFLTHWLQNPHGEVFAPFFYEAVSFYIHGSPAISYQAVIDSARAIEKWKLSAKKPELFTSVVENILLKEDISFLEKAPKEAEEFISYCLSYSDYSAYQISLFVFRSNEFIHRHTEALKPFCDKKLYKLGELKDIHFLSHHLLHYVKELFKNEVSFSISTEMVNEWLTEQIINNQPLKEKSDPLKKNGLNYCLNFNFLRAKSAEEQFTAKEIEAKDFQRLLNQLTTIILDSLTPISLAVTEGLYAYVSPYSFYDQELIKHWTTSIYDSNEEIESYAFYFYTILQAILEAPTEIKEGQKFSTRDEMLEGLALLQLNSSNNARIRDGIVRYYNHLPAHYRMARYKNKGLSKFELQKSVVFQSIQTSIENLLIDDNFLIKMFGCTACSAPEYTFAAKNSFHKPIGLLHKYIPSPDSPSLTKSKEQVLILIKRMANDEFLDNAIKQIKRDFNELLQEPNFFEGEEEREIDDSEALRLLLQSTLLEQL